MKKRLLVEFLCLFIFIVSCQKKPNISKLDSWNNIVMSNIIKSVNIDALSPIEQKLNVAIKMTINAINIKTLYQEGIEPRTILQNVVTAEVPLNKLLKLTTYDFIKAIKIYDKRHEIIPFPDSINTKLFIGIIDAGFGFHKDYFSNRIFSYWDQTASTFSSGTNIPGLNYGVEYGRTDIIKRFYDEGFQRLGLHGSFCSLLAGGNKFSSHFKNIDNEQSSNVTAPLIIVETTKDEGDIIDAINYIKKKSQLYNSKCVINLSESKHNGAHDGTSFLAKAINDMISDSCLIVVSSGNDGALNIHNDQKFKDSTSVDFIISKASETSLNKKGIYINSYYNKNKKFRGRTIFS